jgi:restriction system protein
VQAKRYASGRTVGRPELQAFAGALQGAQASRGVFITTSQFSRDAVDFAERVPQRIILIDGPELARLMVEHGVGVQTDQVITLVKVDEDFFE